MNDLKDFLNDIKDFTREERKELIRVYRIEREIELERLRRASVENKQELSRDELIEEFKQQMDRTHARGLKYYDKIVAGPTSGIREAIDLLSKEQTYKPVSERKGPPPASEIKIEEQSNRGERKGGPDEVKQLRIGTEKQFEIKITKDAKEELKNVGIGDSVRIRWAYYATPEYSTYEDEEDDEQTEPAKHDAKNDNFVIKYDNLSGDDEFIDRVKTRINSILNNKYPNAIMARVEKIRFTRTQENVNLSKRNVRGARHVTSIKLPSFIEADINLPISDEWHNKCALYAIHKKLESCGNKIKKHTVDDIVSIVALHRFKTSQGSSILENSVLPFELLEAKNKIDNGVSFDEKEVEACIKNPSDDFKQFRDDAEGDILENGICPIEIEYVCMYYRISHYCIDFQGQRLMKYVGPNKTKSLCYLTDGEHMYPIHNTKQIREISHLPEGSSFLQIKNKEIPLNMSNVLTFKTVEEFEQLMTDEKKQVTDYKGSIFFTEDNSISPLFEKYTALGDTIYNQNDYRMAGHNMASWMVNKNLSIHACKDLEKILKITEVLGIPVTTKTLSISTLSRIAFENEINPPTENKEQKRVRLPVSKLNKKVFHEFLIAEHRGGITGKFLPFTENDIDETFHAADINKNFTYALCRIISQGVFDSMCDFVNCNITAEGDIKETSFYKIELKEPSFLLRSDKCTYSGQHLLACIKRGIDNFKIVQSLDPAYIRKIDYRGIIYNLYERLKTDDDVKNKKFKDIINTNIGNTGKWRSNHTQRIYCNNFYQACATHFDDANTDIEQVCESLFMLDKTEQRTREGYTNIPLYTRIIQDSWVQLYDLKQRMGPSNHLVALSTDCCVIKGKLPKKFTEKYVNNKIGGYKLESTDKIKKIIKRLVNYKPNVWDKSTRQTIPEYVKFINDRFGSVESYEAILDNENKDYNVFDIDFPENHDDFKSQLASHIINGGGCLLLGEAGCGKTTIAKEVIKQLNESSNTKKIVKCAFTHKAALNLKGTTIHQVFRMYGDSDTISIPTNIDWIIIDEVSMVPRYFYHHFERLKEYGTKFLILGDFDQLPPVLEDGDFNHTNTWLMKKLVNGNMYSLTYNWRNKNDPKMVRLIKHIKDPNTTAVTSDLIQFDNSEIKPNDIFITATNRKRKQMNELFMDKMIEWDEEKKVLEIDVGKLSKKSEYQNLRLVVGSPIIATKEYKRSNEVIIHNQEMATVTGWNDKNVFINLVNFGIPINKFKSHFTVAHAVTCHRLQGDTRTENVRICEFSIRNRYKKRWSYTGVTRATSWDKVSLYTI